jgi:hypothetical protein
MMDVEIFAIVSKRIAVFNIIGKEVAGAIYSATAALSCSRDAAR